MLLYQTGAVLAAEVHYLLLRLISSSQVSLPKARIMEGWEEKKKSGDARSVLRRATPVEQKNSIIQEQM